VDAARLAIVIATALGASACARSEPGESCGLGQPCAPPGTCTDVGHGKVCSVPCKDVSVLNGETECPSGLVCGYRLGGAKTCLKIETWRRIDGVGDTAAPKSTSPPKAYH
jgi:hypothetical protein